MMTEQNRAEMQKLQTELDSLARQYEVYINLTGKILESKAIKQELTEIKKTLNLLSGESQ